MKTYTEGIYDINDLLNKTLKQIAEECDNADHVFCVIIKNGSAVLCSLQKISEHGVSISGTIARGGLTSVLFPRA